MSILGQRVLRTEDPKFLTSGASYVADLDLPGALSVAYVRSPVAHALVRSVDLDAARRAPGVVAVFAGADVDAGPMPAEAPGAPAAMRRPLLARERVRFVGEPVAAVVATSRAAAVDAAEAVVVDYEPLPAVVEPEAALAGEDLLFPEAGTNLVVEMDFGRTDAFFDGCEVVVRQRIVNQRVAPCPLEVRAAAARVQADGRVTYWVSTQAPHSARDTVAACLGLDKAEVHVVTPDVGGGFGAKIGSYPEEVFVAWLARRLGRPVRWVETRSESMLGLGHGRAQVQEVEVGGRRDGTILAYRLDVVQDAGAYPSVGALLPFFTRMMATGVYRIERAEFRSRTVVTNTTPVVAYRGAGRPEATAAIERAVDLFAAELGLDPAEVRRRNLVPPDAFPYTTPTGTVYDSGDYRRDLDLALERAGYAALRAEQAARRAEGATRQLGIGLSTYVEVTNGLPGGEWGSVEVLPSGRATVLAGTSPHGQGHATAFAMLAADATGLAIEDIDVRTGDTDLVPRGGGTMGSRSLQTGGIAVRQAAETLVEQARRLAAELLEAAPDDVVHDASTGSFSVAGSPTTARSWAELGAAAAERADWGRLQAEADFTPPGPTFPFGAHVVVVEVDTETGQVQLRRVVAVDDAGALLNPLLAEGQVHGGIAQGVAQALLEEVRYDAEGNPLTANLADYPFVSATELPSFELSHTETPTPRNPLGVKGIGESGTIGATPAVQNAVVDALAHLGVRHLDMPARPERIWEAVRASSGTTSR